MRGFGRACAVLMTLSVIPTSTLAAGVPLETVRTAAPRKAGVAIEMRSGDFTLVTLGNWLMHGQENIPEKRDASNDPVAKRSRTNAAFSNQNRAGSFRRAIYLHEVEAAERLYALPTGLLDALIWTESRYNPSALSKAGAAGLGQLMPATARELGVANRYDPRANVWGSGKYLRQLLDRFSAIHLAVAAYNAGPRAVETASGVPLNGETPRYVHTVLRNWGERGK